MNRSHPIRVRGLKHFRTKLRITKYLVAPYTGAWIETYERKPHYLKERSHPIRVRGLKRESDRQTMQGKLSHPIRVRGLKQVSVETFVLTY